MVTSNRAHTMDSSEKSSKFDENARTYCEILARSSLPEVAKWEDEDLERAFHWSNYFKRVHSRVAHRASSVEKVDKKFREIGRQCGWRFGGEVISYSFLAASQQYLTKALLENPALPIQLREKVLQKLVESEGKEAGEDILKHLNELDSCKQLLETLQAIHIKVKDHVETNHPDTTPQPGLVSVDAACLLEDVHWLISLKPGPQKPELVSSVEAAVHKKLNALVEVEGGIEVVLQALLTAPSSSEGATQELKPISLEVLDEERKVILDWFLQQINCKAGVSSESKLNGFQQRLFLECPPDLLARVSTVHFVFFKEYIKLLMAKAEELDQYSVQNIISSSSQASAVTNVGTNSSKDLVGRSCEYDLLENHFRKLSQSGEHVREVCVSLLKSKVQPPVSEKYHLPPMMGTIWNKILHSVSVIRHKK